jgi:hypothetical protein
MKRLTAKTGILLTSLLVAATLVFASVSATRTQYQDDCTVEEKSNASETSARLNLKGMTRHLLDFYK